MADKALCTCHHGSGCTICAKRDPNDHRRWCPAARPAVVQPAQPDGDGLRQRVQAWIDETPDQTAGLDLLRQLIADGTSGDQQDGAR